MIRSWMVIGGVAFLLALGVSSLVSPKGIQWFKRLRRPDWLTFEKAIPVIWTIVFTCGAWSAIIVWDQAPGVPKTWFLMGLYLLVELVTLAYSPVMFATQSLRIGTIIGAIGGVLALVLAILVGQLSGGAALLLVPYLLWSPIGTYTTWAMSKLNPSEA